MEASEPGASGNADLKGLFYGALRKWLSAEVGAEVTEVTDMESGSYDSGGCESCSYTVYRVDITYMTPDDLYRKVYEYDGTFQDMLTTLLDQDV